MLDTLRATVTDRVWEPLPAPMKSGLLVSYAAMGPVLFVGGFAWDALTLSRIDALFDNLFLGAYLVLLAVALVLHQRARDRRLPRFMLPAGWVFRLAVHFFFGGLLSAYVVYYLRSATFGRTLLFLGLLAGLLFANEFLQRFFRGAGIRLLLYLFCAFSFLLFWIPVATGLIGRGVWALAAIGAFVLTALVRLAMDVSPGSLPGMVRRLATDVARVATHLSGRNAASNAEPEVDPEPDPDDGLSATPDPAAARIALDRIRRDPIARLRWQLAPALAWASSGFSWLALLLVLFLLDLGGMIPPVPISVLTMGVYRDVQHTGDGAELTYAQPPWWRFWDTDNSRFVLYGDDRVCVFAPVYAPRGIHPQLYHRWERWNAEAGAWEWTGDRGTWVRARGGRDDGSPHHTCKRNGLQPGPWRVTVETEDGRVVATHRLTMVAGGQGEPTLVTRPWP